MHLVTFALAHVWIWILTVRFWTVAMHRQRFAYRLAALTSYGYLDPEIWNRSRLSSNSAFLCYHLWVSAWLSCTTLSRHGHSCPMELGISYHRSCSPHRWRYSPVQKSAVLPCTMWTRVHFGWGIVLVSFQRILAELSPHLGQHCIGSNWCFCNSASSAFDSSSPWMIMFILCLDCSSSSSLSSRILSLSTVFNLSCTAAILVLSSLSAIESTFSSRRLRASSIFCTVLPMRLNKMLHFLQNQWRLSSSSCWLKKVYTSSLIFSQDAWCLSWQWSHFMA